MPEARRTARPARSGAGCGTHAPSRATSLPEKQHTGSAAVCNGTLL